MAPVIKLYFSDFFGVTRDQLDEYGAFDISLVTDLPLFIDPFLLFNSKKIEYRRLHDAMIRYLRFLREKSATGGVSEGLRDAWYRFPEISQTWFGFTKNGNKGLGLGRGFGRALDTSLADVFREFGKEKVTKGSHLEKLCLVTEGVGNDKISDFTTNLIHGFLLRYTAAFAKKHIKKGLLREVCAPRVSFNYDTEVWESGTFLLPFHDGDYVLLTPRDILTKDDTWINRGDLVRDFESIPDALPSKQLREQVNNYFRKRLPKDPTREEHDKAAIETISQFPEIIDAFIRRKEDTGDQAESISSAKVQRSHALYVRQFGELAQLLLRFSQFYSTPGKTYAEAYQRVLFFKDVVENKGGHKLFYLGGKPLERESDVHVMYRLTWFGSSLDVTREADDGRGPVDFKVSDGQVDKTLVEFKLAGNPQLKRNLASQARVYERASDAKRTIKVIVYFTKSQLARVERILKELQLTGSEDVVSVDARNDNKASGSKA